MAAASAALVCVLSVVAFASSAAAAELAPPALNCPASVGSVGYPVATPRVADSSIVTVTTGMLPAGLRLDNGAKGTFITGKPDEAGTSAFMLHAVASAPDGTTSTADKNCTITVRKAPTVTRISGADRFEQFVAVAQAAFPEADTIFVASGEKFPDALSATAIAASNKAPLLLTGADRMPAAVLAEITALAPKDIVVVGGPVAIHDSVIAQLDTASEATVTRIGGADRFEVSRNLISDRSFGIPDSDRIHLVTGANFPDALTASPAAAAASAPVLLVNGSESAPTAAEQSVMADLGVEKVYLSGGVNSIGAALETSLAKHYIVARHFGADRFETGITTNQASFETASTMFLASGTAFPDALSGGVVAGISTSPLYITQSCVSTALYFEIGRLAPEEVVILGGTAALGTDLDTLKPCSLDG